MKALTVRLEDDVALALALSARVDGITVAKAVRDAVVAYLGMRQLDQAYRDRRARMMEMLGDLKLPPTPSIPPEGSP